MVETIDFSIILTAQFWIVAACCGALGEIIKRIPKTPDWLIPIVNVVFAVVMMIVLLGLDGMNVLAGILAASVATWAYETFKNVVEAFKAAGTKTEE